MVVQGSVHSTSHFVVRAHKCIRAVGSAITGLLPWRWATPRADHPFGEGCEASRPHANCLMRLATRIGLHVRRFKLAMFNSSTSTLGAASGKQAALAQPLRLPSSARAAATMPWACPVPVSHASAAHAHMIGLRAPQAAAAVSLCSWAPGGAAARRPPCGSRPGRGLPRQHQCGGRVPPAQGLLSCDEGGRLVLIACHTSCCVHARAHAAPAVGRPRGDRCC